MSLGRLLPPLSGNPAGVTRLANALRRAGERVVAVNGLLLDVRSGGVWDSDAGRAFEKRVTELSPDLDHVTSRYLGAASALEEFAVEFAAAQREAGRAVRRHARALRELERLKHEQYAVTGPIPAEAEAEWGRRMNTAIRTAREEEAAHATAMRTFARADERCVVRLRRLCGGRHVDTVTYRTLGVVERVGHDVALAVSLPGFGKYLNRFTPVGWIGLAADGVATAAGAVSWLIHDDRTGWDVAASGVTTVVGFGGGALRRGAVVRTARRADGTYSGVNASTAVRLRLGARAEAGQRIHRLMTWGPGSRVRDVPPGRLGHLAGPSEGRIDTVIHHAEKAVRARRLAWTRARAGGTNATAMYLAGTGVEAGLVVNRGTATVRCAVDRATSEERGLADRLGVNPDDTAVSAPERESGMAPTHTSR